MPPSPSGPESVVSLIKGAKCKESGFPFLIPRLLGIPQHAIARATESVGQQGDSDWGSRGFIRELRNEGCLGGNQGISRASIPSGTQHSPFAFLNSITPNS